MVGLCGREPQFNFFMLSFYDYNLFYKQPASGNIRCIYINQAFFTLFLAANFENVYLIVISVTGVSWNNTTKFMSCMACFSTVANPNLN